MTFSDADKSYSSHKTRPIQLKFGEVAFGVWNDSSIGKSVTFTTKRIPDEATFDNLRLEVGVGSDVQLGRHSANLCINLVTHNLGY